MPDIRSHKRVLDTLTGPVERPVLRWLASRMPCWVKPDMLTGLGVAGSVLIFFSYGLSFFDHRFLWLASLGFVINWMGDSLDGTLARYRHIERPIYGFYIDHVLDVYSEVLIFLGIGLSPYVRFDFACLALIGYLALSVITFVRTCVKGEFVLSFGKLGPTEVRLIAVSANILVFVVGNPSVTVFYWTLSIYDWVAAVVIVLLFSISLATVYTQARELSRLDKGRVQNTAVKSHL
jgi:archaetidylinositol phosphate synthase